MATIAIYTFNYSKVCYSIYTSVEWGVVLMFQMFLGPTWKGDLSVFYMVEVTQALSQIECLYEIFLKIPLHAVYQIPTLVDTKNLILECTLSVILLKCNPIERNDVEKNTTWYKQ